MPTLCLGKLLGSTALRRPGGGGAPAQPTIELLNYLSYNPTTNAASFSTTHTPPATTDAVLILITGRQFTSGLVTNLTVTYDGVAVPALYEHYSRGNSVDGIQAWVGIIRNPAIKSNTVQITAGATFAAPHVEFFSLKNTTAGVGLGGLHARNYAGSGAPATLTTTLTITTVSNKSLLVCVAGMAQGSNTLASFSDTDMTEHFTGLAGSGTTTRLYKTTRSRPNAQAGAAVSITATFNGTADVDIGGILLEIVP